MNIYDPSIFDNLVFVIGNITRNSENIVIIAKVHKSAKKNGCPAALACNGA